MITNIDYNFFEFMTIWTQLGGQTFKKKTFDNYSSEEYTTHTDLSIKGPFFSTFLQLIFFTEK